MKTKNHDASPNALSTNVESAEGYEEWKRSRIVRALERDRENIGERKSLSDIRERFEAKHKVTQ